MVTKNPKKIIVISKYNFVTILEFNGWNLLIVK